MNSYIKKFAKTQYNVPYLSNQKYFDVHPMKCVNNMVSFEIQIHKSMVNSVYFDKFIESNDIANLFSNYHNMLQDLNNVTEAYVTHVENFNSDVLEHVINYYPRNSINIKKFQHLYDTIHNEYKKNRETSNVIVKEYIDQFKVIYNNWFDSMDGNSVIDRKILS